MGKKKEDSTTDLLTLKLDTEVPTYYELKKATTLHERVIEYLSTMYPHVFATTTVTYLASGIWATQSTTITGIKDTIERTDIQEDIEDLVDGILPINLLHARGG